MHKLLISRESRFVVREGHRGNEFNAPGLPKPTILYPSAPTSPAHQSIYYLILRLSWEEPVAEKKHTHTPGSPTVNTGHSHVHSHGHQGQTVPGWGHNAISLALSQPSISKPKQEAGWAGWGTWQMQLSQGPTW